MSLYKQFQSQSKSLVLVAALFVASLPAHAANKEGAPDGRLTR